jgi:hypothetical protein
MTWSREEQVQYLVSLPWTVVVSQNEGDVTAEVSELPFLVATGRDMREASRHLYEGLWSAITAHLEHMDPVPLPPGASLPWEHGVAPPSRETASPLVGRLGGDAWTPSLSAVSQSLAL